MTETIPLFEAFGKVLVLRFGFYFGKVIFEGMRNVDVYGTYEDVGNNFSLYILQAFDGTLEFRNCTNYAHITGLLYNGAFLGGYPQSDGSTVALVYDNCVFAGEMITRWAGFCTGNAHMLPANTDAITVTNCSISGSITGLEKVGIYNGHSNSTNNEKIAELNEKFKTGFTGVDKLKCLTPASFTASYDSTNEQVTISGAKGTSYTVMGYYFTRMMTPQNDFKGTLLLRFEASGKLTDGGAVVNYAKRGLVDYVYAKDYTPTTDKNGNDIVKIDDTTYYFVKEIHPHIDNTVTSMVVNDKNEHIVGNMTYCVYIYDADGNPCGYSAI